MPDTPNKTFRELGKRLIGGYTGGSEPNSISLSRFRAIAGCCVGTAPIALELLWNNTVTVEGDTLVVNIHTEKETEDYKLSHLLPDEGSVTLLVKKKTRVGFRLYSFISSPTVTVNGNAVSFEIKDGVIYTQDTCDEGSTVSLVFAVETVERKETFAGKEYTEIWRGGDMVDILPRGEHIRLYQRDTEKEKYYPLPEDVEFTGASDRGPTQQSPNQ